MSEDWQHELAEIFETRGGEAARARQERKRRVRSFISEVVVPAFEELAEALQEYDRDVEVEFGDRDASIRVLHEGEEEFYYEVRVRSYKKRDFAFPVIPLQDAEGQTYRAEAHLKDRPLNQDVTDCTKDDLIRYVLHEYQRHLKWYL